jgi:hypothetical protein
VQPGDEQCGHAPKRRTPDGVRRASRGDVGHTAAARAVKMCHAVQMTASETLVVRLHVDLLRVCSAVCPS